MAGQQFSLKWHSHSLHLANSFNVLRSEEDFLTDVTLCCEGKKIKGHKIIFSVCSTYFRETFMDNPCKHPVVIFKNVKFDDLANIVEFMYKGEVSISQDSLSSFLHVAEMLQVRGLSESQELIPEKSIISTPVSTQSESLFISVPEGNKLMLATPQNIGTTQHQSCDNIIKSSPLKIQQQIQQIKTTHFVDQSGVPAKRKRFTLRETRNAKVSTSNASSTNVINNQQQFVTETLDSGFAKQEPSQQTVIVDENGKESIYGKNLIRDKIKWRVLIVICCITEEVEYLTMKTGSGIPEYVVSAIENTEQSQDHMEEMTLMQETFEIIEEGKQGMSDDAGNETGTGDEQNEIITQIDSEGNSKDILFNLLISD